MKAVKLIASNKKSNDLIYKNMIGIKVATVKPILWTITTDVISGNMKIKITSCGELMDPLVEIT